MKRSHLYILLVLFSFAACKKNHEQPAVNITGFTPAQGAVGTSITINGNNFSATATNNVVHFNGTTAVISSATTTALTVTVPTGATTGKISVSDNGLTATSATDFIVFQAPTIISFTPDGAVASSNITITGTNFDATAANNVVKFNGIVASVTSASATALVVSVPAAATSGKITVTVNGLIATSASDFTVYNTPTIASFTPAGAVAGGSVTITGTNFNTTATNNTVKFNGTVATVSSASATALVVTVPAAATSGKITVTVNSLTATSATDFNIYQAPTITSFNPASNNAGGTVTITGTNFDATAANNVVKFNGTAATVTSATATTLVVNVPTGATDGKITVTTNGITAASATDFTVITGVYAAYRVKEIDASDGSRTEYYYDPNNRLASQKDYGFDNNANALFLSETIVYNYSATGELMNYITTPTSDVSHVYENDYTYLNGVLQQISFSKSTNGGSYVIISTETYTYQNGQMASDDHSMVGGNSTLSTFTYSNVNGIQQVVRHSTSSDITYTYDTSVQDPTPNPGYDDQVNPLLTSYQNSIVPSVNYNVTYTLDGMGRLGTRTETYSNKPSLSATYTYVYEPKQ